MFTIHGMIILLNAIKNLHNEVTSVQNENYGDNDDKYATNLVKIH